VAFEICLPRGIFQGTSSVRRLSLLIFREVSFRGHLPWGDFRYSSSERYLSGDIFREIVY
jgi:hypothetical protein